ncbi:MAG: transposase [Desulfobacterales bacterium]|nr:transposase [Desulfobacterales bacterium]MDD4072263.1 transposase [Desulfobacterales bacterium]MDD4392801.1 transposase [Desulfobacterales bacterium]
MSRSIRIAYPKAWYHVMNRGRRVENIFLEKSDYKMFVALLQETSEAWNIRIAAYCLMPTRYHLLVHTPEANISRAMRHLNGLYTQRFNSRRYLDGSLFRGRYKSIAAIYLIRKLRRDRLKEIGLAFMLKKYSTVSSIIERMKSRMKNDQNLKKRIKKLEAQLKKSQEQT